MDRTTVSVEHVRLIVKKPCEALCAALEQHLRRFDPAVLQQLAQGGDPQVARARLESLAEPSGFMLFQTYDHGAALRIVGPPRQAVQYVLGNPLFAVEMTRYALGAALYAPLRLLVYEMDDGRTAVEYDLPSSLFAQFHNDDVDRMAKLLDGKLHALISTASQ